MDIQPILYVCSYLSTSEDQCSLTMTQAVTYVYERELDNHEQMRTLANAYLNKRDVVFRDVSIMTC